MTIDVSPVNDPATGKPVISGVRQVGETLTVSTAGIADVEGLPDTLSLQWGRTDANDRPTYIDTAVSSTYTLTASEVGSRMVGRRLVCRQCRQ